MDKYFTILSDCENEIIIERSRFIASAKRVENDEQARAFIAEIRKKHSLATHNCYAYVTEMGQVRRFSDDGEPSGTAGVPMLDAIIFSELTNVAVVVTRYFGGIKLGAGGLVRAYSSSVSECLKVAKKIEMTKCQIYRLCVSYDLYNKILKPLSKFKAKLITTEYNEQIEIVFAVKIDFIEKLFGELNESASSLVSPTYLNEEFVQLTDL